MPRRGTYKRNNRPRGGSHKGSRPIKSARQLEHVQDYYKQNWNAKKTLKFLQKLLKESNTGGPKLSKGSQKLLEGLEQRDRALAYRIAQRKALQKSSREAGRVSALKVASLLEFGTSKMTKRPFISQSFQAARGKAMEAITASLKASLGL